MAINLIGKILLNQYRVDAFIASGGTGAVYRVWDLKRNVPLAMKVLHAELAEDPSVFKRFQREARALQKLAHPNIVPFYGLFQTQDIAFLLERFVDGPTLKNILRQSQGKPLSIEETLVYLKALSAAIGYAHANGVVHCDIKPGNVMIDAGGNVYLTDFGIARHAESTTTTVGIAGTPAYMAPEQIRGEPVTPATDVYALGVMLYEMLTGQRPFRGDEGGTESAGPTAAERIRYANLNLVPPDPRSLNPAIPPQLADAVLRALVKKPEGRCQTTQELFEVACVALGVNIEHVGDRVSPPAPVERSPVQPATLPRMEAAIPKKSLFLPLLAGGAGITCIILISIIIIVLVLSKDRSTTAFPGLSASQTSKAQNLRGISAADTLKPSSTPTYISTLTPLQTHTSSPTSTPTRAPTGTATFAKMPTPTITQSFTPTPNPESWRQGKLAFVEKVSNQNALFILDLTRDTEPQLLVPAPGEGILSGPTWSPDGERIAFYVYLGGLRVVDAVPGAIPKSLKDCYSSSWSPDGSQIACFPPGLKAMDIIDSLTGALVTRIRLQSQGVIPAWSPLGNEIVFASMDNKQTKITLLFMDSGNTNLLAGDAIENYAPSWSPDGQWIAYQSNYNSQDSEIWIMDRLGNNKKQITFTPNNKWSRAPSWSPDGKWLVYVSNRSDSIGSDYGEIFVTSVETGVTYPINSTGGLIYDWRVSWGK